MVLFLQIVAFVLFVVAAFGLVPRLHAQAAFVPGLVALGLACWVLSSFLPQLTA